MNAQEWQKQLIGQYEHFHDLMTGITTMDDDNEEEQIARADRAEIRCLELEEEARAKGFKFVSRKDEGFPDWFRLEPIH